MASQNNIEFRVGITVLIGLIILFVSIYWLQGYKLERNSQSITVRFDDVGTLSVGDKVTVLGVHRGKVNQLDLTEDGVQVELLVYQDVILKRDATFTIQNLGVMGERFIAINPGRDSVLLDIAEVVPGRYDIGIPEVMGKMGEMILELRNLVTAIKNTVASDSALGKFNQTVTNVERLTSSLADYVERNDDKLDQTAENFLDASRKISRMVTRNEMLVDSSLQRIERTSAQLEHFAHQLDTLSQSARRFADMLETEDGTIQMLFEDRRLYDDLRKTADNIDDLITDIRENPEKYLRVKVEIF